MKKALFIFLPVLAALFFSCTGKRSGQPRVLIFSKTAAFRHASIPQAIAAIQKLGVENGFETDTTENAAYFSEDSLGKYAAVIFLHTTGDVLSFRQQVAFERYIQAGGGYVGVHAAADTEYDWGWFGRLTGAYFNGHPEQQEARFFIKNQQHESTKHFTDTLWTRKDELYNYKKINLDINVLITIDESSYTGGTNGSYHPMAWYHGYDGGRAFYTGLGHTEESYTEKDFLQHLLGGIQYAIGENQKLNYKKATSQYPPDEDRFVKTTLVQGKLLEPTEMTILPNLDVLIVQRRGEIMLYSEKTKTLKQVGYLPVYWKATAPGVNAEEGLMGLCKDPNFEKNNWVYMYYSPVDSAVNRLSRFTFTGDNLDRKTEKVILEVKSQREICCHTGGSIAFGPDGLLYLSTGDNSTPFDEPNVRFVNSGFGPLNDIPGHQQYDARRSSANTNDLRGKILRIRVKDDGSYEIPEGNLFAKNEAGTRPEIYVMGNRNPYRISVDPKNSYLYWGEVGPDAAADSFATRGPKGYDEVNQARKAGFFGWPLFVGNNYAYRAYDYETGKSGEPFDPARPINNSRNNTGLELLPPAQPAFIWYPYGASPDFPQVGTGGRNAMAGPVYYTDLFPKNTRLPEYYNGKLLVYDWIRGWVKAVTLLPNGDFDVMEPFIENIRLSNCIDMETGPDGRIYLLEYGAGWFTQNEDAGLSRIDYISGNRPPKITSIETGKITGSLPFTLNLEVTATDPEKDKLTYFWHLGDNIIRETKEPQLEYTYEKAGDYLVSVVVKDSKGDSAVSQPIAIYAGNETPELRIELSGGNQSFYVPGLPLQYKVVVTDKNDNSPADPANFYVTAEYIEGFDKAGSNMGHQQTAAAISGKSIMQSLDCKSCHKEAEVSIGPSYLDISKRYAKQADAVSYLADKIINGSKGTWGEAAMAAHPALPKEDARKMVQWILSLSQNEKTNPSLPPAGTIIPQEKKPGMALVLSASYTDKGGVNIKPLTGHTSITLPGNYFLFTGKEKSYGYAPLRYDKNFYYPFTDTAGWVQADSIDLTGIKNISLYTYWADGNIPGYTFEIRAGGADGLLIGKKTVPAAKRANNAQLVFTIPVDGPRDGGLHTICVIVKPLQQGIKPNGNFYMMQFTR